MTRRRPIQKGHALAHEHGSGIVGNSPKPRSSKSTAQVSQKEMFGERFCYIDGVVRARLADLLNDLGELPRAEPLGRVVGFALALGPGAVPPPKGLGERVPVPVVDWCQRVAVVPARGSGPGTRRGRQQQHGVRFGFVLGKRAEPATNALTSDSFRKVQRRRLAVDQG